MVHRLKTWPEFFQPVVDGVKTFEVRNDDRGFNVGDQLLLAEWDPVKKEYSGRACTVDVTYIMKGLVLPPDLVVMQIKKVQ